MLLYNRRFASLHLWLGAAAVQLGFGFAGSGLQVNHRLRDIKFSTLAHR